MLSDDYVEKVLQMVISQPKPDFCVLALRDDEDAPPALDDDAIMDDVIIDIASQYIIGHIVGEFYSVGPLLSFDILLRFVSLSDDVLSLSSMDLSIFEYSPVSFIDDIDACACASHSPVPFIYAYASHSPTSQIHQIDDEPLQLDFDDSYQYNSDHSFTNE